MSSTIEQKALAACRELVAAQGVVKAISKRIGDHLSACEGTNMDEAAIERGDPRTHLAQAYEPETVENDSYPGTHKEWNNLYLLDDCPHCLAAHHAIQERKLAKKRLGAARRVVSLIGRAAP